MGIEQTNNDALRFRCDNCNRAAEYGPNPFGPTEESARVAGWRIGLPLAPACYCPECVGTDAEYWQRRTLDLAAQAGVQSGFAS